MANSQAAVYSVLLIFLPFACLRYLTHTKKVMRAHINFEEKKQTIKKTTLFHLTHIFSQIKLFIIRASLQFRVYCRLCGSDVTNLKTLHRPGHVRKLDLNVMHASVGLDVSLRTLAKEN